MGRHLPKRLGHFDAAAELTARQPWEWQSEACALIAGTARPTKPPPGLEQYVAEQRAAAALAVRRASACLLRDAIKRAQMKQRGVSHESEARFYGWVTTDQVRAQIDHTLMHLCAIGPKRTWQRALEDAQALLPDEVWRGRSNDGDHARGRGWCALGDRNYVRGQGGNGPQPQKKPPELGPGYGVRPRP